MEIMTSWKEEGLAEGRQQGLTQGLTQGRSEGAGLMATRLLRRRFGPLPEALEARVRDLPTAQIEEFGEVILDFATLDDAKAWLNRQE